MVRGQILDNYFSIIYILYYVLIVLLVSKVIILNSQQSNLNIIKIYILC